MDYFNTFEISATGLMVEKLRLDTVAMNLANANAVTPPGTEPYHAARVLSRPIGGADFKHVMNASQSAFGVRVDTIEPNIGAAQMVYDPGHPYANAEGFVAHANVDSLSEMVTMMGAVRAYEANIKAMNAAKSMAQQALEIGNTK